MQGQPPVRRGRSALRRQVERLRRGGEQDLQADPPAEREDQHVGEADLDRGLVLLAHVPAGQNEDADGQVDPDGDQEPGSEVEQSRDDPVEAHEREHDERQHGDLLGFGSCHLDFEIYHFVIVLSSLQFLVKFSLIEG